MWGPTLLLCPLSMPSSTLLSSLTPAWPPSTLSIIILVLFSPRLSLYALMCSLSPFPPLPNSAFYLSCVTPTANLSFSSAMY